MLETELYSELSGKQRVIQMNCARNRVIQFRTELKTEPYREELSVGK